VGSLRLEISVFLLLGIRVTGGRPRVQKANLNPIFGQNEANEANLPQA
jgi:hypothetical protein